MYIEHKPYINLISESICHADQLRLLPCILSCSKISQLYPCGGSSSEQSAQCDTGCEKAEYPIVCLGAESKTHEFYAKLFAEHGLTLRTDIEAATADQILPMVKNDLGIGFVPEEFIRSEKDQLSFFVLNLAEEIPPRYICIVKRTDTSLSPAAKELERMLLLSRDVDRNTQETMN